MIIESSSISTIPITTTHNHRFPLFLGGLITLTATAAPLLFILLARPSIGHADGRPTGSLLSPLPTGTISETTPSPTPLTENESTNNAVIVASPPETTTSTNEEAVITANTQKQFLILPAGQNEVVIRNASVTTDTYIRLIPVSATNDPVFIKAKGEGYFIVSTNRPPKADLLIEYHLVSPN